MTKLNFSSLERFSFCLVIILYAFFVSDGTVIDFIDGLVYKVQCFQIVSKPVQAYMKTHFAKLEPIFVVIYTSLSFVSTGK